MSDIPNTLLQVAGRLPEIIRENSSDSIIQYTDSTRITPTTLIDSSLKALPELNDVLQVTTSIYAGYYLLAVQMVVQAVIGVNVTGILGKVKPNRSVLGGVAVGASKLARLAREDYTYRLPKDALSLTPLVLPTLATESADSRQDSESAKLGRGSIESLNQDVNLAVGKTLEVLLKINNQEVSVPVNIRLNSFTATPQDMVNIASLSDPHQSGQDVRDLYMAGQIDFFDALTAKTRTQQWRKAAANDKTNHLLNESMRQSKNKFAAVVSGDMSVANISGVTVISSDTARAIEAEIGGKLSNFTIREKLLKDTATMLLVVVKPDWKAVTFYHHSIDGETSYGFSELKKGGKSTNHDIGSILEAYRQGSAPKQFF